MDALQGIGWGADEVDTLWRIYEAARAEEDKAKAKAGGVILETGDGATQGSSAGGGSQGFGGGGAGALALGVLSRLLTTLQLLYDVRAWADLKRSVGSLSMKPVLHVGDAVCCCRDAACHVDRLATHCRCYRSRCGRACMPCMASAVWYS